MTNQYRVDHYNAPVTDEERAEIRRLHGEGHGRNQIARLTGRSTRTISVQALAMGLTFDRAQTEEATRARRADLAEKRAILAEALVDDALRLTEQIWEPAVVYSFGGPTNSYSEHPVKEPPPSDKRLLMAAATNAAAESRRQLPPSAESGTEDAMSMVGKLFGGLAAVAERIRAEETGGEEAEGGPTP